MLLKFQGKFILTFNYGNHSYGLNRDTIEGIARDGLASCIHMEIEVSVFSFSQFILNACVCLSESIYLYISMYIDIYIRI